MIVSLYNTHISINPHPHFSHEDKNITIDKYYNKFYVNNKESEILHQIKNYIENKSFYGKYSLFAAIYLKSFTNITIKKVTLKFESYEEFDELYYLIYNTIDCDIQYHTIFFSDDELCPTFFNFIKCIKGKDDVLNRVLGCSYTPLEYNQILINAICAAYFDNNIIYVLDGILYLYYIKPITCLRVMNSVITNCIKRGTALELQLNKKQLILEYVSVDKYFFITIDLSN